MDVVAEQGSRSEHPPAQDVPASSTARPGRGVGSFLERYVVAITLVALIVIFSVLKTSTFATLDELKSILTTQAALLILAVGLTVSLGAGEFDLSIAGVISLSAIMVAKVGASHGTALALIIPLAVALISGSVVSLLIVRFRANSFIVTLATGTLLTGVGEGVSGSVTLGNVPHGVTSMMTGQFLGVGLPFWYAVVIIAGLWFFLEHTPTGRYVYFTGEGRRAASLAGIRVDRIRVLALLITAVGAWAAGAVLVGQTSAANSTFGEPYLLQAFAAAFLGAATIKTGRFNIIGTVIAVFLLAVGSTGLQLFGLATWVTDVFDGAILIIAITFASIVAGRRSS